MTHCRTCKHWTDEKFSQPGALGMKLCKRIEHFDNALDKLPEAARDLRFDAEWDQDAAAAFKQAVSNVLDSVKAVTLDASSYRAELYTRPDFGCVLHEPNPS